MNEEPENDYAMRMHEAMNILREMSIEEIKELFEANPLYKYLMLMDKEKEKKWHIKKK